MCYYRDRSRKVSKRPTERLNPRPQGDFLGATRGSQVFVQQQLDAKQLLCANREPLPNFLRINRLVLN